MRFRGLDLNLLLALKVLLEEKNVTSAARRLNISQPGLSSSLKKLREYFNDDLLEVQGKRMIPTAHALQIEKQLKNLLEYADHFLSISKNFDPAISERTFSIAASDYVISVILGPMMERLVSIAPNVKFEVTQANDETSNALYQGNMDMIISPHLSMLDQFSKRHVFTDRFVVVGCQDNPLLRSELSEEEFYNSKHVGVRIGLSNPTSIATTRLEKRGRPVHTYIQVSSFLAAPQIVLNTNLLTTMHESLARLMARFMPITILELPFDMEPIHQHVFYSPARQNDPGINWIWSMIDEQVSIINTY